MKSRAPSHGRSARRFSHVVGFDDAPFDRGHCGDVTVVGTIFAGATLEGVLRGKVRRDGANATSTLVALCDRSRFRRQLQLILLQGIALAGFNVVDLVELSARTGLPVLVVVRKAPNMVAIRRALHERVRGGAHKWRLIVKAGLMERAGRVWVQRIGLSREETAGVLAQHCRHSLIPEPLRTAHIVASAYVRGESCGRV